MNYWYIELGKMNPETGGATAIARAVLGTERNELSRDEAISLTGDSLIRTGSNPGDVWTQCLKFVRADRGSVIPEGPPSDRNGDIDIWYRRTAGKE